jgi:hypothetical protein
MGTSKIARDIKVELYNKMVASLSIVELKGATIPYTSVNGHMYSFLSKYDVVGLRLPAEERARFLVKNKTKLVEQYGVVQKEYVVVPDELLLNTDELKQYFLISYKYVSGLKPTATTKGKKKRKA